MNHSYMASARHGVARKIERRARALIELDESFASAGGLRLLGRLHTATPRIPLFTGWINRREGIELLRRANAVSQEDARNPLFLAEALAERDREARREALELARQVCSRTPSLDQIVEESETLAQGCSLVERLERDR